MMIKKLKDEGYTDEGVADILKPAEEKPQTWARKTEEQSQLHSMMSMIQNELHSILKILKQ
jgi:hypothetical protein